ncbi:MAG: 30S ribosomal protein S4 [Candidatus Woesearchaeota archaeon]|nr:MAG: 30S ribosomal protein S4 [Candidatus Woesearchaeota archaeon]
MGDPRRLKSKYENPSHPWQKNRLDEEAILRREYGIPRKNEIWKAGAVLKKYKQIAKKLISRTDARAELESKELQKKLLSLGMLTPDDTSMDRILGLTVRDVLNRRLQTVLFKKGLANTQKQARQFITHEHVTVNGTKITVPGYLVRKGEESTVGFATSSQLYDQEHPERQVAILKKGDGEAKSAMKFAEETMPVAHIKEEDVAPAAMDPEAKEVAEAVDEIEAETKQEEMIEGATTTTEKTK